MASRHQEPRRRAEAGVGLETCPGMRKTMEDMHQDQEVLEVVVKGTRNNINIFFNCTSVIKIQFSFKNRINTNTLTPFVLLY